jgi:CheY-like chemotaxis protein
MGETARILVVDDQAEIRDLTALILAGAGFRAQAAGSGAEALDRLASEPFDLVLLDIDMPEMDGWETLRLLRADPPPARPSVVMFSVQGEIQDKVHSLQEGASGYITKPFAVDDLVQRIRQFLADRRGAGSGA